MIIMVQEAILKIQLHHLLYVLYDHTVSYRNH